MFNASMTQFLHLSTRHNLPDDYFFFSDTQLSPSSTLNVLHYMGRIFFRVIGEILGYNDKNYGNRHSNSCKNQLFFFCTLFNGIFVVKTHENVLPLKLGLELCH